MANPDQIKNLKDAMNSLSNLFQKNLLSRPEWGVITFDEAKSDLERAKNIVSYLNLLPIENLPDNACTTIINAINRLDAHLKKIDQFTIKTGNPEDTSKGIISGLHPQVDEFYSTTSQWIPFLAYQKGDVAENINRLTTSVQQAKEIVLNAEKEALESQKALDKIIVAAREASASAGAAVFTVDFEAEYGKNNALSKKWLTASIVFLVITLAVAIVFWYIAFIYVPENNFQLIQVIVSKLIILSMLVSATVWCGKNYRILKHLAILNRHKSLSIRTLQAFISAASDDQTKNAVLIEANRAVFALGGTGYLECNNEKDSSLTFIELAKPLLKAK